MPAKRTQARRAHANADSWKQVADLRRRADPKYNAPEPERATATRIADKMEARLIAAGVPRPSSAPPPPRGGGSSGWSYDSYARDAQNKRKQEEWEERQRQRERAWEEAERREDERLRKRRAHPLFSYSHLVRTQHSPPYGWELSFSEYFGGSKPQVLVISAGRGGSTPLGEEYDFLTYTHYHVTLPDGKKLSQVPAQEVADIIKAFKESARVAQRQRAKQAEAEAEHNRARAREESKLKDERKAHPLAGYVNAFKPVWPDGWLLMTTTSYKGEELRVEVRAGSNRASTPSTNLSSPLDYQAYEVLVTRKGKSMKIDSKAFRLLPSQERWVNANVPAAVVARLLALGKAKANRGRRPSTGQRASGQQGASGRGQPLELVTRSRKNGMEVCAWCGRPTVGHVVVGRNKDPACERHAREVLDEADIYDDVQFFAGKGPSWVAYERRT